MAKDPAFLFYPNDWIGGTMGMTFEEKGAYMELLMMQFNRGHMSEDMIGRIVGHHWDTIKDKFIQDENGLWYNERLQDEKEKRKRYVDSRRNNKKGSNQYTKKTKHKKGHMTKHMGNEDENVNRSTSVSKDKRGVGRKDLDYPFSSDRFFKAWEIYKQFRKDEHNFKYKAKTSEQAALTKLGRLSEGNEQKAIDIIRQTIENGWKGLFELDSSKKSVNYQSSSDKEAELMKQLNGIK